VCRLLRVACKPGSIRNGLHTFRNDACKPGRIIIQTSISKAIGYILLLQFCIIFMVRTRTDSLSFDTDTLNPFLVGYYTVLVGGVSNQMKSNILFRVQPDKKLAVKIT